MNDILYNIKSKALHKLVPNNLIVDNKGYYTLPVCYLTSGIDLKSKADYFITHSILLSELINLNTYERFGELENPVKGDMSAIEYMNRINEIKLDRMCFTYKDLKLNDKLGYENPEFSDNHLAVITAKIKPFGSMKQYLQEQFDIGNFNLFFSIRGMQDIIYINNKKTGLINKIVTWDLSLRGDL